MQLSVSSDFSTLQLTGPIVFGVTRRVRDMLDAYPSITTLRLTSPGGRVVQARGLPDWFIERAFTTPNSGMWRPSFDEMRTAHVVTGQVAADGRRIGLQGAPTLGAQYEQGEDSEWGQAVNASEAPH